MLYGINATLDPTISNETTSEFLNEDSYSRPPAQTPAGPSSTR